MTISTSIPATAAAVDQGGDDPLKDCLLALARFHDLGTGAGSMTAGLPLVEGRLTPSLFLRAARRIGLACRLLVRPLPALRADMLPLVLLLQDNQACLLFAVDPARGVARVSCPGLAEAEREMPLAELEAIYLGRAIAAWPRYRFERRAPSWQPQREGHWFWQAVRGGWPLYRDALLAALLINLCALAVPLVSMNVYDRVVPNMAFSTLWVLVIGAVLVLVFDFLLKLSRSYLLDLAGKRIDLSLSALIMERVLGIRMENRPASVGAFAANLRAFETVRDFIASGSVVTLVDLPFVVLFLLVMLWLSPWFVLPVLVCGAAMLLQAWLAQDKMKTLSERTLRAAAQRNAQLVESLGALETVKALAAEGQQQARWEQSTLFLAQIGARLKILAALTGHFSALMQQLAYVSTLALGVYLILDGSSSPGGIIAAGMLASRAIAPLGQLVSLLTQYHNARSSLASVETLMSLPVERETARHYFPRAPFRGAIEFRQVHFSYPDSSQAALEDVSFVIRPGERVGIVGPIGSGKSTVEKLVLGLYRPQQGTVLIDGCDVRQIDPDELRRHIGYTPQDTLLFYGSLRQNLLMGAPEADDAQLLRAVRIAGLGPLVDRHPLGFDLPIGERGETLSGGQRRAVGIARALVRQNAIVLLDEPTSNMDGIAAARVTRALKAALDGVTVLLVTHQPELLSLVERLIVIDRGRVVLDGPRTEVLEALRNGRVVGEDA